MTLWVELTGAIVRWLLTIAGASLVTHHVLTADQSDRFSAAILHHLLLLLPVAVPLGWSLLLKWRHRVMPQS